MSAESAVQTATLLQNKVGASLAGVTNLLTPEEKASTILQAGSSTLPVFVLDEMKELQRQTYECVEKVANLLQTQIDIAQEAARRQRDQAAELRKENRGTAAPIPLSGSGGGADDGLFGLTPDKLKNILTLGLGSVFTLATLKTALKKFGGKLLRGGIIATFVNAFADPIVNFIDDQFKLELDDQAKQDLKTSLVGAAALSPFGIPGIIVGATIPYISRVGQYIAGTLNADEMKDSDFAGAAIGGTVASVYTAGKLGKLMALSKLPAVKTLGMALASTPVLLAVGIGVAAGVGASFLAKKIDEYQEMTLKKLRGTVEKLDREMGQWAAQQEESLLENFGVNMGTQSALGEAKIASQEANEQVQQNKERFIANTETQENLRGLKDAMIGYSDEAIQTILQDGSKARNLMTTIENLQSVAAKGGFGEDSKEVFASLAAFSDRVQNIAIKMVDDKVKISSVGRSVALNKEGIGGDQLENIPELERKKAELISEQSKAKKDLEQAKLDLEDAKTRDDKKDVRKFKSEIRKLERLVGDDGDSGSMAIAINRINEKIDRFGTTNGLLYNLSELRELYKGDEETLKDIIQRSVNQQGTSFLQEQIKANEVKNKEISTNTTIQDNKVQTQNNNAKSITYVGRLNTDGDPIIVKEGYTYGL